MGSDIVQVEAPVFADPGSVALDQGPVLLPDDPGYGSSLRSAGQLHYRAQLNFHILGLVNQPRWSVLLGDDVQVGAALGQTVSVARLADVPTRIRLLDRQDLQTATGVLENGASLGPHLGTVVPPLDLRGVGTTNQGHVGTSVYLLENHALDLSSVHKCQFTYRLRLGNLQEVWNG